MTRPQMPALSRTEFVALMAMMSATIAFSIDAMLPALPEIAQALSPEAPNRAQLILTSFVLGMGLGTLVAGPLSDSFGRKPVLLAGSALYCLSAAACIIAPSLETLLIARICMGLGAAGPRVVAMAIIRDLYAGRGMAKIVSFVMMVFTLVPAIAPLLGAGIIAVSGWRAIFAAFILFSLISALWLALRQPETLRPQDRRPLRARPLWLALREVFAHADVRRSMGAQALIFGTLFGTLSSVQQIYDITFDRAASFPMWFGIVAILAGSASFVNARIVERLGMRKIIGATLIAQTAFSATLAALWLSGALPTALAFPVFVVWQIGVFAMAGLTLGNLNAIAMAPMGHIAGMAASVMGSVATIAGAALAAPIGLAFNGTPIPAIAGVAALSALAYLALRRVSDEGS